MHGKELWQSIYQRFDPVEPARERGWRARRERSPAAAIETALAMPFADPRVLVLGTVGTGKSTELLRLAEDRAAEDFVVMLDLHRHFSQVVSDENALERVQSWEVVALAGLAVVRAAQDVLPYPVPKQYLDAFGHAWQTLSGATGAPASTLDVSSLASSMMVMASQVAPAALAALDVGASASAVVASGLAFLGGAVGAVKSWTMPLGRGNKTLPDQDADVQGLLATVNTIIAHVQQQTRRVLLVIDGLDRIRDPGRGQDLFLRSEMIAHLACRIVVCGPFALRFDPSASAIPRFSKIAVLVNEPVLKHDDPAEPGPGIDFFCELYRQRVADLGAPDAIPDPLLRRLAYYSGGQARDFVKSIRMVAEQAWAEDSRVATSVLVDKVLNEARQLLETGLDRGHIQVLEAAANDPEHRLPEDDRARLLLNLGKLLPYPNESEWYYPHPLLTMHFLRTGKKSSGG